MTIHHATIKRAASLGIVLTEVDDMARAHHTERNRAVDHPDPKVAVFMCQISARLALEYPMVRINGQEAYVNDEAIWNLDDLANEDGDSFSLTDEDALDAAFSEIVDAIPEGTEEEGDEEPEEGSGKVIVGEKYKSEYKARGDASGCGDWLHVVLKRYTSQVKAAGEDGKVTTINVFDDVGFTKCLAANGIPLVGKWSELPDSGQRGWQGRYRMNGRQKLEIPVCIDGVLHLEDGTTLVCPSDELAVLRAKHPALLEEIETAEEEAKHKAA